MTRELYDCRCPYCGEWVKRELMNHVKSHPACIRKLRCGGDDEKLRPKKTSKEKVK
jgi:predicted DCC family thiol-disulfide oxidoreductase YuxK